MAGNFVAGSVSVLVKPVLKGFHQDIKKSLNGAGMDAVGRDIGKDISNPIKDEATKGGREAKKNIDKELSKSGKTKLNLTKPFSAEGKKAGQAFARSVNNVVKSGLKLGAVAAVAGGAFLFKDSIKEASDLEQSIGALESVFGDSASTMRKYSEEAAQTVGLSKNEYNELSTLLGTQLKAGGLDGSELTKEVNGLTTLGADLSSMYGGTTTQAVEALGSALRGEMEPARQYGITLDQAAIQNKALEMGLISAGDEMDQQARTQATLALFTEQTADAQGNFARENDTLAGKTARARASFDNMKATLGEALLPALTGIMDVVNTSVIPGFEKVAGAMGPVAEFIGNNFGAVATIVSTLTGLGVAVYAAGGGFTALSLAAGGFFTTIKLGLKSIPVIGWIITAIGLAAAALTYFFKNTETGQQLWAKIWPRIKAVAEAVVTWFKDTALPTLTRVWEGIVDGARAIWAKIQPVWDGIRLGIGLFINWATATLVPRFKEIWASIGESAQGIWENFLKPAFDKIVAFAQPVVDWIKGLFSGGSITGDMQTTLAVAGRVFGTLRTIFSGVVGFVQNVLLPIFKVVFTVIGAVVFAAVTVIISVIKSLIWLWQNVLAPVAMWLWQNVIVPVFNGIRAAVQVAISVVTAIIQGLIWFWQNVLAPTANFLWGVIKAVWTGIRIAIAVAVTAINAYIDLMKWYFKAVIAPVALWLYNNIIKPVWAGIKSAISATVTWFRDVGWPILKAAWNALAAAARWLYNNVIRPVWAGIKSAISAVVNWFRDVAWPILSSVIGWIRNKFEQFKLGLQIIWRFIRNNVINPVVQWFMSYVWPTLSRILGYIKTGFNAMRDSLKAAWSFIKNRVISPVVNWFADTVKPKIDNFTGKVKDAFNSLKESVLNAWKKIKDGMKKPINGVIGIYNEHIADNFNNVAKTLGLDEKYQLKKMNKFSSGGYTGPGAKYKEAGIVHADEFVIRKESQNDLRRKAPGFLDSLNRFGSRALGYANGGLVKLRNPFAGSYPRGDGFGARSGRHKGIDWPIPAGTALKAVAAGTANRSRNYAAGNKLELSIGNGLVAGYHHLSGYAVANGASVGRGADIGYVGSTGRSSGPHLHFSLKRNGKYVDPAPYLSGGGEAGSGGGGWWNPFDNLWSSIKSKVADAVGDTPVGAMVSKIAQNTIGGLKTWVVDKIASVDEWIEGAADTAGGWARWSPVATQALTREGQFGPKRFHSLMNRMQKESNFNPRAINNWDVNAKNGTPSKGLMQVIKPTFDAYRDRSLSSDIYDPLANIVASIRYTLARYGDLERGWNRSGGYADGGLVKPYLHDSGGYLQPGLNFISNQTRKPEAVLSPSQWAAAEDAMKARQMGGNTNIYQEIRDPRSTADHIAAETSWALTRQRLRG